MNVTEKLESVLENLDAIMNHMQCSVDSSKNSADPTVKFYSTRIMDDLINLSGVKNKILSAKAMSEYTGYKKALYEFDDIMRENQIHPGCFMDNYEEVFDKYYTFLNSLYDELYSSIEKLIELKRVYKNRHYGIDELASEITNLEQLTNHIGYLINTKGDEKE